MNDLLSTNIRGVAPKSSDNVKALHMNPISPNCIGAMALNAVADLKIPQKV